MSLAVGRGAKIFFIFMIAQDKAPGKGARLVEVYFDKLSSQAVNTAIASRKRD
jgi:hypothetical protein